MTRFISLSSGSNGNCYYIGNEMASLLIDLGIGGRTIKRRLAQYDIDISTIDFVLVTHDHADHIRHLGSFTERFRKPVYATGKLHHYMETHFCTAGRLSGCVRKMEPGLEYECLGVKFTPFSVPHDAHDCVGYHIDFFGAKFTFITDVGAITDSVLEYCRKATHIILESNYDLDMLLKGPYTPELKQRIMQGHGHLSNEQCAEVILKCCHKSLDAIFLCHLSENNNTPAAALESARKALKEAGAEGVMLCALPRHEAACFEIS